MSTILLQIAPPIVLFMECIWSWKVSVLQDLLKSAKVIWQEMPPIFYPSITVQGSKKSEVYPRSHKIPLQWKSDFFSQMTKHVIEEKAIGFDWWLILLPMWSINESNIQRAGRNTSSILRAERPKGRDGCKGPATDGRVDRSLIKYVFLTLRKHFILTLQF